MSKRAKTPSKRKPTSKKTVAFKSGASQPTVAFFYDKCTDFRTIHVDGAIGGPTPRGYIHVAVYSERQAIPKRIEVKIDPEANVETEVGRDGKNGILRELQCDLVLDLNAAQSLADWLQRNVAMVRQALSAKKGEEDV